MLHAVQLASEIALAYVLFSCLCGGAWVAFVTALRGRSDFGGHLN
jgi:hypothetical protein